MSEWGKVPKEAFTDGRLTRTDVRVLGILCAHANGKTGLCTRKQGAIADELGLSRETVNRAMKKLSTLGYVEPRQRAGMKRSLDYRVLVATGVSGQLGLFDTGAAPRQAKPKGEKPASRCERKITSVVTPEITSVVTPDVTSKEQTLVNREPVGSAQPRESDRGVLPKISEPVPIRTDGRGDVVPRAHEDRPDGVPLDRGRRSDAVPVPAVPTVDFLDKLEASLLDAAGGMLGRESIGLRMLTEPLGWINAGCDLERDILPTIVGMRRRWEATTVRAPPKHTWRYFAAAVLETRDRRLAGERPAPSTNVVPFDPRGSHVPDRTPATAPAGRFTDAAARRRRQFAGETPGGADGAP